MSWLDWQNIQDEAIAVTADGEVEISGGMVFESLDEAIDNFRAITAWLEGKRWEMRPNNSNVGQSETKQNFEKATCPHCNGTGFESDSHTPCEWCGGDGWMPQRTEIRSNVGHHPSECHSDNCKEPHMWVGRFICSDCTNFVGELHDPYCSYKGVVTFEQLVVES